jgi:tetratricopeptide (TPR) repeat protein
VTRPNWERSIVLGDELPQLVPVWPSLRSYLQAVPADAVPAQVARDLRIRFPSIAGIAAWDGASDEDLAAVDLPEEAIQLGKEVQALLEQKPVLRRAIREGGGEFSDAEAPLKPAHPVNFQAELLKAGQELRDRYRTLAARDPDTFLPHLAESLNILGTVLSALGRQDEALDTNGEAVTIQRRLVAVAPGKFEPDLARGLGVRGTVLGKGGNHGEAAAAFREALLVLLPLAQGHPSTFDDLLDTLARGYLKSAQAGGIPVDDGILAEVAGVLKPS